MKNRISRGAFYRIFLFRKTDEILLDIMSKEMEKYNLKVGDKLFIDFKGMGK